MNKWPTDHIFSFLTRGLRSIHELLGWDGGKLIYAPNCKLVPRALSFHTKRRPLPLYLASTVFYRTLGIQPWKYPENQLTMYTISKPVCKRQILSALIEYKKTTICYNTSSEGFIHRIADCAESEESQVYKAFREDRGWNINLWSTQCHWLESHGSFLCRLRRRKRR